MKSNYFFKNRRGIFEYIKNLKNIKKFLSNKEIALIKKIEVVFIVLIMAIYLVSPIDIVPDFIPVFGYLEDVIVVFSMLSYAGGIIDKQMSKFGTDQNEKSDKSKKQKVIDVKFIDKDKTDPE